MVGLASPLDLVPAEDQSVEQLLVFDLGEVFGQEVVQVLVESEVFSVIQTRRDFLPLFLEEPRCMSATCTPPDSLRRQGLLQWTASPPMGRKLPPRGDHLPPSPPSCLCSS